MVGDGGMDEKLAPHDFVADFIWAARAVSARPAVALVSVVLWCFPIALLAGARQQTNVAVYLVLIASWIFYFGWCGAGRLFFLHRKNGSVVSVPELLRSSRSFMGPFFRLGVRVGIVATPLLIVGGYVCGRLAIQPSPHPGAVRLCILAIMVPVDLILTFVPAALVFTTRSSRDALRIGLRMIRETWPRSGLYVLCPPLALNMVNAMYPTQIPLVSLVTTAFLALLALVTKGATTAFYLRERPPAPEPVAAPALN